LRSAPANVAALRPPESYASCSYYGVHAFRWVSADGSARFVRSTLVPAAGEHRLTVAEARSRGRDFLTEELRARLVREPVRFDLRAVVAVPGDPVEDPSARWPLSRQTVIVGTLELTGLEENRETGGDVLVFDPTRVTDGIELSDDPVLRFRSPAYSASVAQRTATH
ncbi:MAG TPA: catalase, partial [Mycobacteriales bacterium]|nr:catalase [Mycobacteriales bacterium]